MTPASSSDSSSSDDDPREESSFEIYYTKNSNSPKILLCMALGMKDKEGNAIADHENDNRFPKNKLSKWRPNKTDLLTEIKRRRSILMLEKRFNQQSGKAIHYKWLQDNPLRADDSDVTFVTAKVASFLESNKNVAHAADNDKQKEPQWSGMIPHLRLIHCLVDFDNIRAAFMASHSVMTHLELDGRHNPETMQQNPWTLIADKWNDKEYNPSSSVCNKIHSVFSFSMDLSHTEVEAMGDLTPEKAKTKYTKMKNELLVVKNNWEKSGNGDGTLLQQADDTEDDEIMFDADDKRNFLQGRSPTLLYLWEKAEEHQLLQTVLQELNKDTAIDSGGKGPNVVRDKSKNNDKNKDKDDEDNAIFQSLQTTLEASNKIAEDSIKAVKKSNEIAETKEIAEAMRFKAKENAKDMRFVRTEIDKLKDTQEALYDKIDDAGDNETRKRRLETRLEEVGKEIEVRKKRLGDLCSL